ncbi:MAG: glycosyltransferase family 4 protein [Candidatus Aenigmarchaeota archaeon]|nr:glycosyltransferase family 4 protein [Candidatus Aenigmarchaeota archaeon]
MFAKYLPVHITGGMEIHIQELVNGLIKRGYKVTLITAPHPQGIEKEKKENLTIHYVKNKPKYTREKFYRESARLFERLNKEESFDIVHSQSTLACGYARYCKKTAPLILTSHGTMLNEIKALLRRNFSIKSFLTLPTPLKIYLLDEPIIYKKTEKIIAVSNELKEDIERQYKVPKGKLVVIPNGIDIDRFKPMEVDDLKKKYNLTDEKVILSIGRIDKQKGFHLLLKIFPDILKEYNNIKLFIVGTGPYLHDLKEMTIKLNILGKVIFTGRVSDGDLLKYYNLADIFAFSTLRMEGLPLVVPEAMACEKPVIASRIGGITSVIDNNKDGILIETGNLKELKGKVLEVLGDEELARKLGKNARKKVVERFGLDRMINDTVKVYEEVIEK